MRSLMHCGIKFHSMFSNEVIKMFGGMYFQLTFKLILYFAALYIFSIFPPCITKKVFCFFLHFAFAFFLQKKFSFSTSLHENYHVRSKTSLLNSFFYFIFLIFKYYMRKLFNHTIIRLFLNAEICSTNVLTNYISEIRIMNKRKFYKDFK